MTQYINNKNVILFDDNTRTNLLPLTFTRPIADLRIGILTIAEKWAKHLNAVCSFKTEEYLQEKFPMILSEENILINGSVLPDYKLVETIEHLSFGQTLMQKNILIAAKLDKKATQSFDYEKISDLEVVEYDSELFKLENTFDIFTKNEKALFVDFELITKGRISAKISSTNNVLGKENIFLEEGVEMEFATLNASKAPIYIGKNALIMEGSLIRAPFAICNNSVVKMGAKIYGATTVGPFCTVGGELNNCVLWGYSNKGHEGFLGNSVLGQWCNLGADTNNSNLKNTYVPVRLWNYKTENFAKTGLQFCGLIMGDHSKSGINSMFNTGTVVGVAANIHGTEFPRNFIPSFADGGYKGFKLNTLKTVFDVAERVMERRNLKLEETDKNILQHIFEITKKYRNF